MISEACHASTGALPGLDFACEVAVTKPMYAVDIFLRPERYHISRLAFKILGDSHKLVPVFIGSGWPSRALPLCMRIGCQADLGMK